MFEGEVLIGEFGAVDGLSTRAVVIGEITALAHETGNHTVKGGSLEAKALFPGAKGAKIFGRLGDNVGAKLHDDASGGLAADGDIKVNLRLRPAERKIGSSSTVSVFVDTEGNNDRNRTPRYSE